MLSDTDQSKKSRAPTAKENVGNASDDDELTPPRFETKL